MAEDVLGVDVFDGEHVVQMEMRVESEGVVDPGAVDHWE